MPDIKLGLVEAEFADIIWTNGPMTTRDLVAICETKLGWKRTTTYTVLKKLCDRGIFIMKDRVVTPLISKDKFYVMQGEQFIKEKFNDSLPAFIAAFTTQKKPTAEELDEIRKLIDTLEEVSE